MNEIISSFHMPRRHEIPDVGLYLEQTAKYINSYLTPLGIPEITTSMISNYVKKGYISNPVKKQYYADQIAYLLFIAIVKNVLSMENIRTLFEMQKSTHDAETAYDYFCDELENVLQFIFGLKENMETIGKDDGQGKNMLRSTIIAVAHIIYLGFQFRDYQEAKKTAAP
jgi:hypothetical protein